MFCRLTRFEICQGQEQAFDVTGKLGMAVEPDNGIVADLVRDGKAEKHRA